MSTVPQTKRLTVAVIGLGSIGGVSAGCLAATGRHDVVACARKLITRLTLDAPDGTAEVPLNVLTDPARAGPADWVLLCTKAHHTQGAAPWLKGLCTPATRVAVLQNGIDQAASVAPFANGAVVIPVSVYFNGERVVADPGSECLHVRMRQGSDQDAAVADDEAGRAFAALFAGTPIRVKLSDDLVTLLWRKMLINSVANPVTALTLQRQKVLRRPDVQDLCRAVLEETAAVARAEGAKLALDEPARAIATLLTFSDELGTSMYFDRLAGRQMEVEALTGAIVAKAEHHGVATPLNRALLALLRAVNEAQQA
jgi:2-dehydropantoate 2-reductase